MRMAGGILAVLLAYCVSAIHGAEPPLRFGREALLEAIKEPVTIDFNETPLSDVVAAIRDRQRIQIVVDKRSLDDVGISLDSPVTLRLRGVSLRTALKFLLRDYELSWVIRDGLLEITTPETANELAEARVYPVGDILLPSRGTGYRRGSLPTGMPSSYPDFDSLLELVTCTVSPESWDAGSFGPLFPVGSCLVITQTASVHEEIAALFDGLRKARQGSPVLAIDARWLLLPPGTLPAGMTEANLPAIDPAALDALARDAPGYRVRLGSLSGQWVHAAGGIRQTQVTGTAPVVDHGAGYRPETEAVNVGVLLELRAVISPDSDQVEVELAGTVTAPPDQANGSTANPSPADVSAGGVDRPALRTEQWATVVRLPRGRPVLVGSVSRIASAESNAGSQPQLHLFLSVEPE